MKILKRDSGRTIIEMKIYIPASGKKTSKKVAVFSYSRMGIAKSANSKEVNSMDIIKLRIRIIEGLVSNIKEKYMGSE
jgi:hypothetical protein